MAITTAAALIGGSIIGAGASIFGSNQAADVQQAGQQGAFDLQQQGIDESRRQFDLIMSLLQPGIDLGNSSIDELSRLFGFSQPQTGNALATVPGGGPGVSPIGPSGGATIDNATGNELFIQPDGSVRVGTGGGIIPGGTPSGPVIGPGGGIVPGNLPPTSGGGLDQPTGLDVFQASPDFQFRQEEGLTSITQTLGAAGTGVFSGNTLRALNDFNSNLASGEFNNFVNTRLALAGLGQVGTGQAGAASGGFTANLGNALSNQGNALINQGNARATGILGTTSAVGGTIQDIIEAIIAQNTQNSAIDAGNQEIFSNPALF